MKFTPGTYTFKVLGSYSPAGIITTRLIVDGLSVDIESSDSIEQSTQVEIDMHISGNYEVIVSFMGDIDSYINDCYAIIRMN